MRFFYTASAAVALSARTIIFLFMFFSALTLLDTRPSSHLITLSARYSNDCGIVSPICFAVLRLITSSNFVGCSTGKSAGLAPFRILST